jgi:hypothetical protein
MTNLILVCYRLKTLPTSTTLKSNLELSKMPHGHDLKYTPKNKNKNKTIQAYDFYFERFSM